MSDASRSRILSLAFPRLPTDRLSRLSRQSGSAAPAEPLVLVEKSAQALRLAAVDSRAAALGLHPGLPLTAARALHPELAVAPADPAADAVFLGAIADWCERYTPLIGLDPPRALTLDIAGCAHLFGGEATMLADMLAALRRQGLDARGAIAGTRAAAAALARHGPLVADGAVVPPGGEEKAVAALPVEALELTPADSLTLRRLGFRTIGALAGAARAPLAARFGADLTRRLDAVLACAGEPISPRRPLPACLVERRFAEPIGHEEDVRRSLGALVKELAQLLERRAEGARRLELVFFRADGQIRRIAVETGRPLRDPSAMLALFGERLAGLADPLDPGFGFDVLRLAAGPLEKLDPSQIGLETAAGEDAALADLVDRLCARFGASRLRRLIAQDSHDPVRACLAVPAQAARGAAALDWSAWRAPAEPPIRPLRLFERPERIEAVAEVPDGPPLRFRWRRMLHEVARAEGPERIAPEWWRSFEETPTRDYFRVEDKEGRRFWIFREGSWGRETTAPLWFLHGLFA